MGDRSRFSLVFVNLDGYTYMGDRSRNTGMMMIVLYFVQAGGKQTARQIEQTAAQSASSQNV
jgi:hypothetical protein